MGRICHGDIYRFAKLLEEAHGDDAPIQAAKKLLEKDDWEGRIAWWRIMLATDGLLSEGPAPDDLIH